MESSYGTVAKLFHWTIFVLVAIQFVIAFTMPDIEPSDVARVRAAWVLAQGADDALNAIEIARRWTPALGPDLANEAASVVGIPQPLCCVAMLSQ